ncbi:MAG: hypothetical protein ACOYU7_08230 [Bacillota bacterium]
MCRGGTVKVAALFVGAVIGAGFASGQEILQFFGVHGRWGLYGALLTVAAFVYLGVTVQVRAVRLRAQNYREVFDYYLGRRWSAAMDAASVCMLAGGLAVMMAGSGAVLHEQFGLPTWGGVILLAVLVILVLLHGLTGVVAVNVVLVPLKVLLVAGVAATAVLSYDGPPPPTLAPPGEISLSWLGAAVLYISYNMVVPVAVLSSLGRYLTVREAVAGAALGGVILGGTTTLVAYAILTYFPLVSSYQVPLLQVAGIVHPYSRTLISVIVWIAIFTTAVANAHGLVSRFAPQGSLRYKHAGISFTLLLLPVAFFKFSHLIGFIYPLFGYAGLVLLVAVAFHPVAGFWQRLKNR